MLVCDTFDFAKSSPSIDDISALEILSKILEPFWNENLSQTWDFALKLPIRTLRVLSGLSDIFLRSRQDIPRETTWLVDRNNKSICSDDICHTKHRMPIISS